MKQKIDVSKVAEVNRCSVLTWTGLNSNDGSKEENDPSGLSGKVSSSSMLLTPQSEDEILEATNLKNFTFNELRTATRNFRPDSRVGEGGFGSVFKGWIDEHTLAPTKAGTGMVIAVKRLNQESNQGHTEWLVSVTFTCHGLLQFRTLNNWMFLVA